MRQRGLLLDRDGVINVDFNYVHKPEQFVFMPGLFPALRAAQDRGYRLAVVTNQSGVARGLYSAAAYEYLTAWMRDALRREGIEIALVLACFEHRDGAIPALARDSYWRKPNPGMVLEVLQRLRLDPARSTMIGDHPRDLEAAAAAGIGQRLYFISARPASSPAHGAELGHRMVATQGLQDGVCRNKGSESPIIASATASFNHWDQLPRLLGEGGYSQTK